MEISQATRREGRHNKQQSASFTSQSCSDLDFTKPVIQRPHAKSHDVQESLFLNNGYPMRKRFYSEGVNSMPQQPRLKTMSFSGRSPHATISQHAMDQIIRGRLDGIDVLSLGPASRASLPATSPEANTHGDPTQEDSNRSDNDDSGDECISFDPLHISFTNSNSPTSPAKLIDEMIWNSAGMEQPEIILEGFYPGGSDRWGVRLAALPTPSSKKEQTTKNDSKSSNNCIDSSDSFSASNSNPGNRNDGDEANASNTIDNDGDTNLPVAELWDSLWGTVTTPPPIPSHMNMQTMTAIRTSNATSTTTVSDDEDQLFSDDDGLQYAAMCNVPIDIDDDAFMIDSPRHVVSIHEVVMAPLQARRFDSAISILEKLLRGLDGNEKYRHLLASTNHNIGMIQLCQGQYQKALESFRKAVDVRKECLPADHPDIAVSLEREGMAHFALASVLKALKCFEAALDICTSLDNARAKILNNIGVVRYQLGDYAQAQKSFTSALEIQRPWLEGPVRRPSIVNIASTILSNMGRVYLREGDHDLAYFVFEEACLMQTSIFRKDHDAVLNSLDNMGRAHAKNGNYFEALRIFTSLHRSQEARFGPNSKVCIETLGMMGIAHFKLLDYEEAEKYLTKVAKWQIDTGKMNEDHSSVKRTTEHLNQIKRCLQGTEPMWV